MRQITIELDYDTAHKLEMIAVKDGQRLPAALAALLKYLVRDK